MSNEDRIAILDLGQLRKIELSRNIPAEYVVDDEPVAAADRANDLGASLLFFALAAPVATGIATWLLAGRKHGKMEFTYEKRTADGGVERATFSHSISEKEAADPNIVDKLGGIILNAFNGIGAGLMLCNAYFGSAAADGSWVEHATNISHLRGFDFTRHLRAFEEMKLPLELQAPLLHEMTHHWCFDSPVGSALSLLRFRLLGNSIRSASGVLPAQTDDELWMDIARYEVAIELMRPIVEGVALFVEHDAVIEGKYAYSAPLTQLSSLVHGHLIDLIKARGEKIGEAELVALAHKASKALVKLGRTTADGVERKADLLVSPIDPERQVGHYLIGYLTLRYIWSQMRRHVTLLHNSDAFASYLRSYFFHDWGLVAAILDDCEGEIALATRIGQHIQKRLSWLLVGEPGEQQAAIDAWDAHADAERPPASITLFDDGTITLSGFDDTIPGINLGAGEAETGQRLLRESMVWFNYVNDPQPEIQLVKTWSLRRFLYRSLMPIVQENGTIVIEESEPARFLTADGKPALAFEPFEPLPVGRHEAAAELLFSVTARKSVLLIFQGGDVVGGIIPEGFEFLLEGEGLGPSFASTAEIETLKVWEVRHRQVMRDTEQVYSILYDHIAGSAPKAISEIYLCYVAGMLNQEDLDAMILATRDTGLLAYLDGDFDLVRSLARLGGAAGPGAKAQMLAKDFAEAGDDLRATLERLTAVRAGSGVPTFLDLGDVIVPLM